MTDSSNANAPATIHGRAVELVADYLGSSATAIHDRLGPVAGVAVTTSESGSPRTLGASTALAGEVDRLQFSIGTGPCLQALRDGRRLHVPDLAADDRWGDYGPRAAALGAAACLSVPLLVLDEVVGVFKVYAARRDGLSAGQRETADLIARELAGGMALAAHLTRQAAELDDLTALMTHRRSIDLALGVLMERAQVTAETAFGLLRTQSQQSNVKLTEVALAVVLSVPGASTEDLVPHYNPHG